MNMKPRNKKGQPHGYWKTYDSFGRLFYEGTFVKNIPHGLWKWYDSNGEVNGKKFYLK